MNKEAKLKNFKTAVYENVIKKSPKLPLQQDHLLQKPIGYVLLVIFMFFFEIPVFA